ADGPGAGCRSRALGAAGALGVQGWRAGRRHRARRGAGASLRPAAWRHRRTGRNASAPRGSGLHGPDRHHRRARRHHRHARRPDLRRRHRQQGSERAEQRDRHRHPEHPGERHLQRFAPVAEPFRWHHRQRRQGYRQRHHRSVQHRLARGRARSAHGRAERA
ncbi:hypothetical protein OY671_010448, partial [Metschnikowia pulcherrima]